MSDTNVNVNANTNTNVNENNEAPRNNPPVMPLGMRFGIASDICFMDLLDHHNDGSGKYCFYSIALTKGHAQQIVKNLTKFIES